MGESTRPSMQSVQKSLIIGVLIGVVLGCVVGAGLVGLYIQTNPPIYSGGAYPSEMSNAYQNHYLAMTVDSYLVNQEPEVALERLKTFGTQAQIMILGERSAAYVAAGRGVEAQLINNLAVSLQGAQGWDEEQVKNSIEELMLKYQDDPARSQAVSTLSAQLLNGQVPVPAAGEQPAEPPAEGEQPQDTAAQPVPEAGGISWLTYVLCCLALLIVLALIYLIGRRQFEARRAPTKQKIEWEGEGAPPLKQWTGTYTFGQDLYDEFFTIETDDGDFLGESGMGIMESIPGTSPKQVISFDVGLFDKTDITTISRVVMSEYAYNDEATRLKVDANPQAEPVLAEPGKDFSFETTALRVEAKIDELEYGEGNKYFEKLTVSMNLFLKEGADIKAGEMAIPDEYQT